MKKDPPLSLKKLLTMDNLLTEPLIISKQAAEQLFTICFGENIHQVKVSASYNLAYNGILFANEGLGIMPLT